MRSVNDLAGHRGPRRKASRGTPPGSSTILDLQPTVESRSSGNCATVTPAREDGPANCAGNGVRCWPPGWPVSSVLPPRQGDEHTASSARSRSPCLPLRRCRGGRETPPCRTPRPAPSTRSTRAMPHGPEPPPPLEGRGAGRDPSRGVPPARGEPSASGSGHHDGRGENCRDAARGPPRVRTKARATARNALNGVPGNPPAERLWDEVHPRGKAALDSGAAEAERMPPAPRPVMQQRGTRGGC